MKNSSRNAGRAALGLALVVLLAVQPVAGAVAFPAAQDAGSASLAQTDEPAAASVTAGNATLSGPVEAGETFTVNVTVDSTDAVYGAQATLSYDATVLDVEDVMPGDFFGSGTTNITTNEAEAGRINYGQALRGDVSGVSGEETLFTVRFRATEGAQGPTTLSELGLSEVILSDADQDPILSATVSGTVSVTDGTAPTARLDVPDRVAAGTTFSANASASTDNGTIANYTFAVDGETVQSSAGPTANLTLSTEGNHTVSVNVTDVAGNTDTATATVFVVPGADLRASVSAPERQLLSEDVVANVTMTNVGTDAAPMATLRLDAQGTYYSRDDETTSESWNVSLAAGESVTKEMNLTDWVRDELNPYSLASGRISLVALADATNNVTEANEGNNRATARTTATFSEFDLYVRADDRLPNKSRPVTVYVRNDGSATITNRTVNVSFGDGESTMFPLDEVAPGRSETTELNHSYEDPGDYTINATAGDESDREWIDVVEFDLDADIYAPETVEGDSTFRVYGDIDPNIPSDVNVTLDLPANLTTNDLLERAETDTWGTWDMWSVRAPSGAAGDTYELNVSASSRNETVSETTNVTVKVPTVRASDTASVALANETENGTTSIEVRGEQTFAHNLTLSVQAGAEGRTLDGLQYLFTYPYGCVEQTTSPMLAALYTDQYYRDRPSPDDYDRDRTNRSILGGVRRLAPDGEAGQHETGAWSMWGNDPRGDMFYTAYAFRGMTAVRNDPVQSERTKVKELASNATDFNETVFWLRDNQESDGAFPSDGYFLDNDESMTGFVTISLSQAGPFNESANAAADEIRRNATGFLLAEEESGSWGDNRSTALALWGLQSAVESDALNESTEQAANESIANATAHLIDVQGDDGAWRAESGYYWDSTGRDSIATSYSLLALNATGIDADDNETLSAGVTHLVGVYEEGGSWGDTEASAVAIQALQTLGQGLEAVDRTVDVTVADDDGDITKTVSVSSTDNSEQVAFTDSELERLRNGSVTKDITVNTTDGGFGATVVALENDQLVNRTQYEANTEDDTETFSVSAMDGAVGTTALTEEADGSPSPFTATLGTEGTLTTRDATLAVTVNNTADETLLNPIVEVPITGAMNASNASAYTVVNDSQESVTVDIINSSFTDGTSVSVFGREVPADAERTYYLNVSFGSPGEVALEADVRPLYNESLNARPNATFDVKGVGNLNVRVANATAANATSVSFSGLRTPLDTNGSANVTLPSGGTNVSADATGALELPNLSVTVPRFGTQNVSYTPAPRYPDPTAVAHVGDAAVLPGSVSRVERTVPNATAAGERNVSFTVADTAGQAVVAFETPAGYNQSGITLSGNVISQNVSRAGNLTVLNLNATGDVGVDVAFDGYVLGNVSGDAGVTDDDAAAIADIAAGNETGPPSADVNGDGRVTVVDAMYAAQYANGERDADYSGVGA